MILWFVFKRFGNGWGVASPYFDDKFYWLSSCRGKKSASNWYKWAGGFGAQLESFEWKTPPAGSKRVLFGREFRLFSVDRRFPITRCAWALVGGCNTPEELNALKRELNEWGHGQ